MDFFPILLKDQQNVYVYLICLNFYALEKNPEN